MFESSGQGQAKGADTMHTIGHYQPIAILVHATVH